MGKIGQEEEEGMDQGGIVRESKQSRAQRGRTKGTELLNLQDTVTVEGVETEDGGLQSLADLLEQLLVV